jgi:hypothetical protein
MDFSKAPVGINEIPETEAEGDGVKSILGERHPFGVALDEHQASFYPGARAFFSAGLHHGTVEIADDRASGSPDPPGREKRQVGRAPADIENGFAGF